MILRSLVTITLSAAMIILAASFLAWADQNKRCPQKVAGPLRFIYLCPEVKTTVKPRVANSRFSAHFEPRAVSDATGCKITTWVITYNKQGAKT
jgi:hypothetical protein